MATRQHLQQHPPEVNIDDTVEDEVKGKVDDLEKVGKGPYS